MNEMITKDYNGEFKSYKGHLILTISQGKSFKGHLTLTIHTVRSLTLRM